MREKELRLAIVLTGGVSLAIFIHGVSRELLKLVRASKIFHSEPDPQKRQNGSYVSLNDDATRECDTEEIYFDLIKALAPDCNLRILIDVIAGTSAGGVNGIMLARALAHDLPLDTHRAMWLKHADAIELMDEKASAKPWSKFYLEPLARVMFRSWFLPMAKDSETREKLSHFVRSRWFKPPFSGERFIGWLLEASESMAEGRSEKPSLMPDEHLLELFVNVTDFHGHSTTVRLHDPARITESEHLHVFRFSYLRDVDGDIESDFDRDGVPGLVFAARATSSFPGAFPPATLAELDRILTARGRPWAGRDAFVDEKFGAIGRNGRNPRQAAFIDGSTVNDRPFSSAIGALSGRPAHREVLRRLIYVDPDPKTAADQANGVPGMLRTMLSALVEIPGNEPVREELERLDEVNRRIRILGRVVDMARPQVSAQVDKILGTWTTRSPTPKKVAAWRENANVRAARNSGFAFESYFSLKVLSVAAHLERLLDGLARRGGRANVGEELSIALTRWGSARLGAMAGSQAGMARNDEIDFLRGFDVDFRIRRLRFVIRRLNELYRTAAENGGHAVGTHLDAVKSLLYRHLDRIQQCWDPETYANDIALAAEEIAHGERPAADLGDLLDDIGRRMGLAEFDGEVDELFASHVMELLDRPLRHALIAAYVGFSFFDVLSFPLVQWEDLDELEEILIHRISPEDATSVRTDGSPMILKGASLRHFGAFFNRSYREHDYLWGRLTAADRLIDVVMDAVGPGAANRVDADRIKQRLFEKILQAEKPFLHADPDLFSEVEASISR